jgi:hypothetical protein
MSGKGLAQAIICTTVSVIAATLAWHGVEGWGWFLAIAFLVLLG